MPEMAKEMFQGDLETAAARFFGVPIGELDIDELKSLITISQFCTDTLLAEIEARGGLEFQHGMPIVPYLSRHFVPTILTRGDDDA